MVVVGWKKRWGKLIWHGHFQLNFHLGLTPMEGMVFSAVRDETMHSSDKPPDDSSLDVNNRGFLSYRDKVLDVNATQQKKEKIDLVKNQLVRVEHEGGNCLFPIVTLDKSVAHELSKPWSDALVITLLGKRISYKVMKDKLKNMWKPSQGFDLMDVDNGFCMVIFDDAADREKVMGGGPWMIFDHYLAISPWTLDFVSSKATVAKTLVWVRFPSLNLAFYEEIVLMAIASAVGRPVKVDENTLKIERGHFARVCIEIDLSLPVVAKVCIRGVWHQVSYEGLHVICNYCGCYGHVARNCASFPVVPDEGTPSGRQPTRANGECGGWATRQ